MCKMLDLENELRHIGKAEINFNFVCMFFSGEPHVKRSPFETTYARLGAALIYQLRRLLYDSALKVRFSIPDFFYH